MGAQGHCKGYLCDQNVPHLNITVAAGLGIAVEAGHPIYKDLLDTYATLSFKDKNGNLNIKTIVFYTTEILAKHGLQKDNDAIQCVDGIYIYPEDYFNPISIVTERMHITENTRTIHWFMASWKTMTLKERIIRFIRSLLPEKLLLAHHERKYGK